MRASWAVDLDPTVGSPLVPHLNPNHPIFPFGCSRPPPLLLCWPPPPHLSLILKFLQQSSPTTLAATPHLLFSKCRPSSFGSSSCWCKFQVENWWEEGRRKRWNSRWSWGYLCFCTEIQLLICLPIRIGRGVVQNFCGWRTAAVLVVSGDFSWVISGNQWKNHVELCHTFSTSTYALDSELYFRRYRCLNPARLLSKNRLQGLSCGLFWAN
jgi:hypothetical protein